MKLVFILGDAAVGKMTVGQALMKITDLRLFHNHMAIEPVLETDRPAGGQACEKRHRKPAEEQAVEEGSANF